MQRIILDYGDGTVGILIPTPQRKLQIGTDPKTLEPIIEFRGPTVEEVAVKDCAGFEYQIVELSEIPTSRVFRDAWAPTSEGVSVDMPRARTIQMGNIRVQRDKRLRELDVDQLRGRDVATEKQALRDLPETFDLTAAGTPEELEKLWPANLER